MDDNRTMAQLLEAPTEGYEDAIVVPEITANNFEIKHGLLNLVQNKQFFGHDKETTCHMPIFQQDHFYDDVPEHNVSLKNRILVPNTEKLIEVFISGLPRSIEGNVTASKPQSMKEAFNIAQRKDIMRISAQKQITEPQESILRDELAFVRFRISTLETTLKDIQVSSESSSV
ncbi:hypothetical protein Tco_1411023 [Tanacetum coccineum]